MQLILASESTYKRSQLETLRIPFETAAVTLAEDHSQVGNIKELAERLSQQKAENVLPRYPNCVILSSDQTAVDPKGRLLTKPGSFDQAFEQLKECSNGMATFFSSVHLLTNASSKKWTVKTDVEFRDLTDHEITRYLSIDEPYDCAGSFKAESLGISLFNRVVSEDPTALIGLPLISISRELRALGFEV